MNLRALALVLLVIYPEVQPQAPYKRHDGVYERVPGWDNRFELYWLGAATGRGGFCYGMAEAGTDPLWLGNSDFLDKDPRSTTPFYDYKGIYNPDYFGTYLSPSTASKLTAYHIMYKGKPLYGWFHLKLETTDKTQVSLEQVYAHVETSEDRYAVAGSFVRTKFDKAGSCRTENAERKYDYKPCKWAQDPFIQAHTTFLRRTPQYKGFTTYHWNVRIEFPLCAIHGDKNAVYFRVVITHIGQKTKFFLPLQRIIKLNDINYGAPDPEPPADTTNVTCTTEVEKNISNWIYDRGALERNITFWGIDCSAESLRDFRPPKQPQYSWGGRCCTGYSKPYSQKSQHLVPRVTHKYHCRRGSAEWRYDFGNFKNPRSFTAKEGDEFAYPEINGYLEQSLGEYTKQCKTKQCNPTYADGISAGSTIGHYIYAGRQGHAFLMAIACFFVYPLTNFITRYCKGTFMSTRYIVNLHPWYAAHIYGTLTTFTLLVTGVAMGIYARYYLGYSFHPAGRTHVALGYITCFLFLGGMITNGLRHGMKPSRNYSIILHACFGVLFYYLALVTIAVAVWIPACPGGQKLKGDTGDTAISFTLIVVTVLFPIFEIVIHVVGTMQLYEGDKRYSVARDWAGFVAIPWVTSEDLDDEAGTELKKILFIVYVVGASIATVIVLVTVGTSSPAGHFFGPMTYTHSRGKLSVTDVETHVETEDLI